MPRLRFLTAGESHGKALVAILEGLPAGLPIEVSRVDAMLALRQRGWGRGGRMKIEQDRVEILSGVRHGITLGSPLALLIPNRDWENWSGAMAVEGPAREEDARRVTAPRPGHADLAGGMKYGHRDLRNVLERASARETAARVAAGALAGLLLERLGVTVTGLVEEIGGVRARVPEALDAGARRSLDESECRCADAEAESLMRRRIDEAAAAGNTVGGVFQVRAEGVVPGLGSYVHWDRRLDARLAGVLMSIPGVKGVEVGLGFRGAHLAGTAFHDAVTTAAPDASRPWRYRRTSNNAGGLEGGVTNGENVVLRAVMKPIPTTARGLGTVDIESGQETLSHRERSDVCAVPAASVVGQAVAALELADACLEKFGGDTLDEILEARGRYLARLSGY